jgi:Protein of unknown function (DUF1488)
VSPLQIATGKLDIGEHQICFRCMIGAKSIDCIISRQALRDLADVCALSRGVSDLEAFSQLLSQIEKIAADKYETSRLQDGELKIGTADLLRFLKHMRPT